MFPFNVRVYGVLMTEKKEVLVADEWIRGMLVTKFPGGGLEFGEGTRDCLKREFMEELNLQVSVEDHLYTTDYYQVSAWNTEHQIISIFYLVKALEEIKVRLNTKPFDFDEEQLARYQLLNETESFRLIPFDELTPESVTLPIEKKVIPILKEKFS